MPRGTASRSEVYEALLEKISLDPVGEGKSFEALADLVNSGDELHMPSPPVEQLNAKPFIAKGLKRIVD